MKNINSFIKKSNFNQIEIWALNLIETNQFAIQLTSNYSFFAIQFKCICSLFAYSIFPKNASRINCWFVLKSTLPFRLNCGS